MGRTLPTECVHGAIIYWGDFGDESSVPELCSKCRPDLTGVLVIKKVDGEWPEWAVKAAQQSIGKIHPQGLSLMFDAILDALTVREGVR